MHWLGKGAWWAGGRSRVLLYLSKRNCISWNAFSPEGKLREKKIMGTKTDKICEGKIKHESERVYLLLNVNGFLFFIFFNKTFLE